jgi:hypothetical protein
MPRLIAASPPQPGQSLAQYLSHRICTETCYGEKFSQMQETWLEAQPDEDLASQILQ